MEHFDCDVYLDLMPLVKDDAASEATCLALRDHLQFCPECKRAFDAMRGLSQAEPDVEAGFHRVRKKLRGKAILTAAIVVLMVLLPVVWLCVWCGNPISAAIVEAQAAEYLQEQYPGNDFTVSQPVYSMKSMGYQVNVQSRSSRDTSFALLFGYFGGEPWDGYESYVKSGANTFSRVCEDVRALLEPALEGVEFDAVGLNSDWPSIYDEFGNPLAPKDVICISQMEIDGVYDAAQMCALYGNIEINREVSQVSAQTMCQILQQVHSVLTEKGLSLQTLNVTIYNDTGSMCIYGFPYGRIGEEDLQAHVEAAARQWEEFQEEYEAWILEKYGN